MAIPIVLCGATSKMGGRVAPHLGPEYEVIQFVRGIDRAKAEIATLQAGEEPPKDPDSIGSSNYSRPPVAVVFGRGIEPDQVEEIRQACGGTSSKLAWIQTSVEGKADVKGSPPDFNDPASLDFYAKKSADAVKEILNRISEEERLGEDGVYYY